MPIPQKMIDALALGIEAGHLPQRLGVDAADRRHLLGRERLDVLAERFEVLGIGRDILLVVKPFGDDHVEQGIEHGHVGARLEGQVLVGMPRQRLTARIYDDQLGAILLDGVFDEGRGHRMVHGRVGADHDDDLGVHRGGEGR